MNRNKDKELSLRCDGCEDHICLMYFEWEKEDEELWMEFIVESPPSFWRRLKLAWKVLRWRKARLAEYVFFREKFEMLREFFNSLIKEADRR